MRKLLFILFCIVALCWAASYTSVYPPAYNDTYVKATTALYAAHYATNPSEPLTGIWNNNQWLSPNGSPSEQRFHIDLGEAKIIKRIYYENSHFNGGSTTSGVQNFTFWGSLSGDSFNETTYATDTGWTQLSTSQSTFDKHASADAPDPKYITVTNTEAYRYYGFKFDDNYGNDTRIGVRRIELQTGEESSSNWFYFLR
jgi:hypothetical protein